MNSESAYPILQLAIPRSILQIKEIWMRGETVIVVMVVFSKNHVLYLFYSMHFCTFAFKIFICWNYYFISLLIYLDYAIISYEIWKQKAQPRLCIRKHQWNTQSDFKGRSKTPHSYLKKSLPKELKKQTIKQKVNLKRHLSSELHPTSRTFGNQSRRPVQKTSRTQSNVQAKHKKFK